MKICNIVCNSAILLVCLTFMACERNVEIETVVNRDGSIDRMIVLNDADSADIGENIFGINESKGWRTSLEHNVENKKKRKISFYKTFQDVAAANEETNAADESVFKIHSEYEKTFRWFFTYYRYADTYKAINRMKFVDTADYFTPEDYAFIQRLPAEGKRLSKADSFYLDKLNERIYEDFALRGYYEEIIHVLIQSLEETGTAKQWIDSVKALKEDFYHTTVVEKEDFSENEILALLKKVNPDLDSAPILAIYNERIKEFEKRFEFMSSAGALRIRHRIQLPFTILGSNCDSLHNDIAYWQPPVTKFMLQDYTMYAEGRELNVIAVSLSVLVILFTGFLYIRRHQSTKNETPSYS